MLCALLIAFGLFLMRPIACSAQVVINEFSSHTPEWVEIYNTSNESVSIEGWKIKDGNDNSADDLTLTGQLGPHQFLSLDPSDPSGWLNDGGDTIVILNSTGTQVDFVDYGTGKSPLSPPVGQSAGRSPDGSTNWVIYPNHNSKGTSNPALPTSTPSPTASPTSPVSASPTPTATLTPSPQATPTPNPLSVEIKALPGSVGIGQKFTVTVSLKSVKNLTEYYVKAYGGLDGENYMLETFSGFEWTNFNGAWNKMAKFKTNSLGSLEEELNVRVKATDTKPGSYRIKIKVQEVNSGKEAESDFKSFNVTLPTNSPTPALSPTPTEDPNPTPIIEATPTIESFVTPTTPPVGDVLSDTLSVKPTPVPKKAFNMASILPIGFIGLGAALLTAPLIISKLKKDEPTE